MKKRTLPSLILSTLFLLAIMTGAVFAGGDLEIMAQMGPPEQLKSLDWLMGTWEVKSSFQMGDSTSEWVEADAVATYEFILDGAAIQMTYISEMMGIAFKGTMIQAYDRETSRWQATWIDNAASRISYYAGDKDADHTQMIGVDLFQGQEMLTRMTTFNESPDYFDWKLEHSLDNGENFWTAGKATYTKKK